MTLLLVPRRTTTHRSKPQFTGEKVPLTFFFLSTLSQPNNHLPFLLTFINLLSIIQLPITIYHLLLKYENVIYI